MRFAYIDSNGNEVPIPSVDALALRIELGAITDETQLYDAQADQWAPAKSHEIYHTLARSSGGDEGFVAPPPVAPPPVASTPEPLPLLEEPEAEPEPPAAEVAASGDADEGSSDLGLTLAEAQPAPESEPDAADGDLGLTLAEAPPLEEGESGLTLASGDDDGFESALTDYSDEPVESVPEGGGFDFGDLEGGLQLEDTPEEDEAEAAMDFSGGLDTGAPDLGAGGDFGVGGGMEPTPTPDFGGGMEATPTPDFSGGMDLETPMEFSAGGFDAGDSGAMDLEKPMSEFSPEAPPSWMDADQGESADDGDVMDFSTTGSESDDAATTRRTPRNKPSAPKLKKQRNLAGPIVGVVLLLAIAIGAYAAWPVLSARLASGDDEEPEVFIPDIPAALLPQMQEIGQAAIASALDDAWNTWAAAGHPEAPPQGWLSGAYLANASGYAESEGFWEGMQALVDAADGVDLAAFDAAYAAELGSRSVSDADGALMRARADSGFVAAAAGRADAIGNLQTLVDAALDLHDFLVSNEDNIEYAPASATTTDPVLEVAPATDQIRRQMESLIDAVTGALGALRYRDVVSAQGLWNSLVAEVQEAGLR